MATEEQKRLYRHNWFTKNRESLYENRRKNMRKWRLRLLDILGGKKCVSCGYDKDFRALNFDHLRDDGRKDRKIHYNSYGFYRFYSENPEIAKSNLQVLCSNCNTIKKYDNMNYLLNQSNDIDKMV